MVDKVAEMDNILSTAIDLADIVKKRAAHSGKNATVYKSIKTGIFYDASEKLKSGKLGEVGEFLNILEETKNTSKL